MSERTRLGKARSQDLAGFLFCLMGGFFAVSTVLAMRGSQPRPGLMRGLTAPVVQLIELLGHWPSLALALGVAVLGTVLFLRTTPLGSGRPLLALGLCAVGLALVLGAFGAGGLLGGAFPHLVGGFAGRALTAVLGLSVLWVGATLLPLSQRAGERGAETGQRLGLPVRPDPAGVSPAEAALLVSEPRPSARPAARPDVVPVREPSLRPLPPASEDVRPAKSKPVEPPAAPRASVAPPAPARPLAPPVPPAQELAVEPPPAPPPVPSWEASASAEAEAVEEAEEPEDLEEEVDEPDDSAEPSATAELAQVFELEETEVGPEVEPVAAAPVETPRASWEQIGLFDEEETELEEEAPPPKPAKVELTPAFDFEAGAPPRPVHEPELAEDSEDPFAAEPAELEPAAMIVPPAPAPAKAPAPAASDFVLAPTAAPRVERSLAADEQGERWSQLVFEAGCAILEQKRVAVSMLERRFAIDFDQACRVLDELQAQGLIGPYMGGRTRDILLTREEWLAHAPHAS